MPQPNGQLSEAEIENVVSSVNGWALDSDDPCPHCGGPSYVHPSMSRIELGSLTGLQSRAIPVVMTVCEQCGFVRQFAASVVGIISATDVGDHEEGDVSKPGAEHG